MKRIFEKGFTLAELMIAMGISAVVILSIMHAQKVSTKNTMDFNDVSELNSLIQLLTSELSRVETCSANFAGKNPTQAVIATIVNKNNQVIINHNTTTSNKIGNQQRQEFSIGEISTSLGTGFFSNQMKLTVNYTLHARANARVGEAGATSTFIIPINVSLVGGLIKSCYSDVQQLLLTAVANACTGSTARFISPTGTGLGSCEHEVRMAQSNDVTNAVAGMSSPGVTLCPSGQVLKRIATPGFPVTVAAGTTGNMTFVCDTISVGNPCPPWQYMDGIDASGNATCKDVRNFFTTSGGFMVMQTGGVYKTVSIACTLPNTILQSIDAAGNAVCVNPRVNGNCPAGQYVKSVDSQGNITSCGYANNATCGGAYITQIDTAGNVTCSSGTLTCASSQVITGVDAAANPICSSMP